MICDEVKKILEESEGSASFYLKRMDDKETVKVSPTSTVATVKLYATLMPNTKTLYMHFVFNDYTDNRVDDIAEMVCAMFNDLYTDPATMVAVFVNKMENIYQGFRHRYIRISEETNEWFETEVILRA